MKNLICKMVGKINIKKNYKLFRRCQNIINPVYNKNKYKDILVNLNDSSIKLRVFDPFKDNKPHNIIIYIHGGGWVTGCLSSYTSVCHELSKELNSIIVCPGYRLAPENPFPLGFNDCFEVTKLICSNTKNKVIIMGDSAGGNLSAAVCQKALDTNSFKLDAQILLYPALQNDYSNCTKYRSVIENGKDYLITQKQIQDFLNHYIKDKKDLNNKYVAPLLSDNLKGLPRTLIITCGKDALRDEGIEYANKLISNKVICEHHNFKNSMHGFLTNILDKKYTKKSIDIIKKFIE